MARDANGNYSLPNGTIVASGDTVLPSQHNPAMNDLASSMTNSLARTGAGGMLADLNLGGFGITNLSGVNATLRIGTDSGEGYVALVPGDTAGTGQIQFYNPSGTRTDFIYNPISGPGAGTLVFGADNANGFSFRGGEVRLFGPTTTESGQISWRKSDGTRTSYAYVRGTGDFANHLRIGSDVGGGLLVEGVDCTAPILRATASGDGQAISIGDDAWLGDINSASTVSVRGQADAGSGYVQFGNSPYKLGNNSGDSKLRYNNDEVVMLAAFANGLSVSGYQRFANGMVLQWGEGAQSDNSGSTPMNFPTPFSVACYQVIVSNSANGVPTAFHGAGGFTASGCTIFSAVSSGVPSAAGTAFRYIAIGR